jgi:beta-phosphoglucomutase-like phosphatase (HAD superfamily)
LHPVLGDTSRLVSAASGGDGRYRAGENGVTAVFATADGKVDFVCHGADVLACVKSQMGYPAIYPMHPARIERPVRAVLMDLDGTTVRSEEFWTWIIERTTARLLGDDGFRLRPEDAPFVSGHSVSEHLKYTIRKYCPGRAVEEARRIYFETTHREMRAILEGGGRAEAFTPAPGVKEFLLALKARRIPVAVVTSGLYEKAWPELVAAFRAMGLGDPREFYDAIVTAGHAVRKGEPGTLGELEAKPHPWVYAEAARVGLGLDFADRHHALGIEDSSAGVVSLRLAGFACAGMAGGNIVSGGAAGLLTRYCRTFAEVLEIID